VTDGVVAPRPRPRWLVPAIVCGAIALLVVVPLVVSYNGLVSKQASVDQSFADLDAQLQRRNDLIPNLVAAVRGVLNQEQTVFGELARARASYAGASTPNQKFDASNQIDAGLGRLLVIVENYPQLRSSTNIQDLQTQLEGTENRIAQARRDYNGVVTTYNVSIRRFPRSMVASMFGFDAKPLFRAVANASQPPTVDLGNTTTTAG
jgi:LemA protein